MNAITTATHVTYFGQGWPRRPRPRVRVPEHIPEGEVWIEITGRRDEFGRVQFFAYWPEDIRWRGGGLVAGQVFNCDDRVRVEEWAAEGKTIRYVQTGGTR